MRSFTSIEKMNNKIIIFFYNSLVSFFFSVGVIEDNPLTISLKEIQKITNLSKNDLLDGFKKIKYNYIINDNNDFNDVMNIIHYININVILIWIIIIFHLVFHF
jgi:hypothetical protein